MATSIRRPFIQGATVLSRIYELQKFEWSEHRARNAANKSPLVALRLIRRRCHCALFNGGLSTDYCCEKGMECKQN